MQQWSRKLDHEFSSFQEILPEAVELHRLQTFKLLCLRTTEEEQFSTVQFPNTDEKITADQPLFSQLVR